MREQYAKDIGRRSDRSIQRTSLISQIETQAPLESLENAELPSVPSQGTAKDKKPTLREIVRDKLYSWADSYGTLDKWWTGHTAIAMGFVTAVASPAVVYGLFGNVHWQGGEVSCAGIAGAVITAAYYEGIEKLQELSLQKRLSDAQEFRRQKKHDDFQEMLGIRKR